MKDANGIDIMGYDGYDSKPLRGFRDLLGKTMKKWLTEAIIARLEDEIDAAEGLVALADAEGTMSLEFYLESRKGKEITG